MAELAELRSEEWIPELELMEKIHLFSTKEIRTIIAKKKHLEYRLQRVSKSKEDYIKYIQFELDLLRLVKARREKYRIYSSKSFIEGSQTKRITKVFKQALFRYQEDVKLWMSFFKFCKEASLQKLGSQMLIRMIQVHADKEDLWTFASKWEHNERDHLEMGREFLLKGIRHHPDSEILYLELFKLELEFAEDSRKMKSESRAPLFSISYDDVARGKLLDVVYDNARKEIGGVNFKVKMLNLAENYPGNVKIRNRIFQDLIKYHSNEEVTWNVLARRELAGFESERFNLSHAKGLIQMYRKGLEVGSSTLKGRINRSVSAFETGIKKINTAKMWHFYLDHLIEINEDKSCLKIFKSKLLRRALEGTYKAGYMREKYFLRWISLLSSPRKQKKLNDILIRATSQFPKSLKLWYARVKHHLNQDEEELGTVTFKEAISKLSDTALLWKLMIQYYLSKSNPKVERIFWEALERGGNLAEELKPMFLVWTAKNKGIGSAKQLFESAEMQNPPCLSLILQMISLEMQQADMNKKVVRRYYEMGCNLAGRDSVDVWLGYVEFELQHGEGDRPYYIYVRALRNLNDDLLDDFINQYNNLRTQISNE